jgi:hypothetical protein
MSPFSAPFGGFHFRSQNLYYSEIFNFVNDLKFYSVENGIEKIELILPPDIYCHSFNAKIIHALICSNYAMLTPDITSIGNLKAFTGQFSDRKCVKCYRQAVQNGLLFLKAKDLKEKRIAYRLIQQNRVWLNRPMSLTFSDIIDISRLWPVDFFIVTNSKKDKLAAAIFYRGHQKIVQAAWWGDNEIGRPLRAMDFLCNNLWTHYKSLDFDFIDIGISTENGIPNEGLLRFKETLDATTELRYRFLWEAK